MPYLLLGLQDVQWAVGNSRGARKLARTPHVNQKNKNKKKKKKGEVVPMTFNLKQSCRFINQVDLIEKKGSYLVFDLAENFDND